MPCRPIVCLNAPDGAGCSLTGMRPVFETFSWRLNAPDGAGCSLTVGTCFGIRFSVDGLNAPDGAGCSLTLGVSNGS